MTLGWAAIVVCTGLCSWLLPSASALVQPALLSHLVVGLAVASALVVYVPRHLASTVGRRRPLSRQSGWTLAGLGALLVLAGVALSLPRDLLGHRWQEAARWIHGGLAFAGVALLWLHRLGSPRERLTTPEVVLVLASPAAVLTLLAIAGRPVPPPPSSAIRPEAALRTPEARLSVETLADTERCAPCHADIVAQWSGSAHHFASFKNPFYLHALRILDETRGRPSTRFCAGCHDPLPLMTGVFESGAPLGEEMPYADRGVTCLVCHTAYHQADARGNGGLSVAAKAPLWPGGESPAPAGGQMGAMDSIGAMGALGSIDRWLTRAAPRAHASRLSSPLIKTSAFCGACHKVGLPASLTGWRFIRGLDDIDSWQQSSSSHQVALPFGVADEKSCAGCHMPRVASRDLAARDGKVLDHRFASANLALPSHLGDARWQARAEEMLREARAEAIPLGARVGDAFATPLDGGAVPAGQPITLHVLVTAPGVAHQFPGGTLDSHETWVELEVKNGRGEVIARHGAPIADGGPDEAAHVLRARPIDARGQPILERDAFRGRTVLYNHTATAGAGELVRYRFRARPDDGPLTITTRLWLRKFARAFFEAVYRRRAQPVPAQPHLLLGERHATVTVGDHLAAGPCAEPTGRTLLRYAPSATAQGDPTTATEVAHAAIACGLAGPGSLLEARAALRANRPARAVEIAANLLTRGGVPEGAARMVHALGEIALGDDATALADLDRLAALFPLDREVHKARARLHARAGRAREAIADADAALAIDPEDSSACWAKMIAAADAGDQDAERSARQCYETFREDETQRQLGHLRRAASPADDLEADPIHIHDADVRGVERQ